MKRVIKEELAVVLDQIETEVKDFDCESEIKTLVARLRRILFTL